MKGGREGKERNRERMQERNERERKREKEEREKERWRVSVRRLFFVHASPMSAGVSARAHVRVSARACGAGV